MRELGTMTNWRLYDKSTTDFALPTATPLHLVGNVTDHPKFADDTRVRSVTVKVVDLPHNTVTTGRGMYNLAEIDEEYAEWLEEQDFAFPTAESETVATELMETPTAEPVTDDNDQTTAGADSPGSETESATQQEAPLADSTDNTSEAVTG